MEEKTKKLTEKELTVLQELQAEFNQLKMSLGDTILQQKQFMEQIEEVKGKFQEQELSLMEIYGKNATIDLQTGKVTDPPKEEEAADLKIEK
tara:strand:+ start:162 stop:437 length:276 start_codon:yes stop_codon:yes gene_type:complete